MMGTFKTGSRRAGSETSSESDEKAPILKMAEREDWALFRSVEGLCQKAGVHPLWLRRLVLKELADNALDTGADIQCGLIDAEKSLDLFFIEDDGPGLDGTPGEIASLFSIRRPMRSSKLLRLPQRGALGNGLRVVAGAVLASAGSLVVITRNKRIKLRPNADGSTTVIGVTVAKRERGTRIEIGFGRALPSEGGPPFTWVQAAAQIAHAGKSYDGRTSPFWYDPVQFHELILAYGSQPLRGLIAHFDGCSGGKAGEIVARAGLERASCARVNREQATRLLAIARKHARPVSPDRLGFVGRNAYDEHQYAIERGQARFGSAEPPAVIPFVVEAWAWKRSEKGDINFDMLVHRTPVTGEIEAYRDGDKDICVFGCGLAHGFQQAPKKGAYDITVNIITPYCPITSDGKEPNLKPFVSEILRAVTTATKKAQRAAPKEKKLSQKDVVLEHLDEAIASASGDGEFRFNERQIYYQVRDIVRQETGQPLLIGNFKGILTDYENEHGEIAGMYREPRGSIYHPHRKETITLGTLMVEDYKRPLWTYNKLVYIEKEGFTEALKDNGWAERHDCMLMSSKGFTTRAARDLVDKLAKHDEPVTVFCVHDADAYGTMIHQTFQEATRARGARKVTIVNLGLEPWEAIADGLAVENVDRGEKHKPVADYVLEREDGDHWDEWLQTHRVELNAMTTPQFIAWLDRKMAEHGEGKLIPPPEVLSSELEEKLAANVRAAITERILREADLEGQISDALEAIERPNADALVKGIERLFKRSPKREWRDHISAVVKEIENEERS
jgi:hypothetical protein